MADKTTGPTVYTALIMPLSSHATFPKPQPPGTPGQPPSGGQPPTGGQPPHPDQTLPGDLPHPEHPIYFPLPPGAPVDPSYGIPIEHPEHPIEQPGAEPHPEHPIVLPPGSGGWLPIFIWGQPHPDHSLPTDPHIDHDLPPIEIPKPPEGIEPPIDFKPVWTPDTGWIVVGFPTGEHVTPSKAKVKK